jgi:hypothetical protein
MQRLTRILVIAVTCFGLSGSALASKGAFSKKAQKQFRKEAKQKLEDAGIRAEIAKPNQFTSLAVTVKKTSDIIPAFKLLSPKGEKPGQLFGNRVVLSTEGKVPFTVGTKKSYRNLEENEAEGE